MRFATLSMLALLLACGDDTMDPPDGATMCVSDADCSDGVFCTGLERCDPTDSAADARGCVQGGDPCFEGQECSESEARCVTVDCSRGDVDGDGVESVDCGGTDCDDADADRFPGNPELCDSAGHDEDCDPDTLGGDMDGDGYEPLECCNGSTCGQDCDDTRSGVSPEAVEACNGVDEDCDGTLDEGAQELFYRDLDGDGFGDPATGVMRACVDDPVFSLQADDCDDRDPATNPSATEICDGRDNDCNPATAFDRDADGDGHLPMGAPCTGGPLPLDDCDDSNPFANAGAAERCSGVDDDCDGAVDESAADDWCTAQARLTGDAGASALCGAGARCVLSACAAGRADCDGRTGNGCEVDTTSDPMNCGNCLQACGSGVCTDGVCVPPADSEFPDSFDAVRVGSDGSCALTGDGRAVCWGDAFSLESIGRPRFFSGPTGPLTDIVDVMVVDDCTCALVSSGQVLCKGVADLDEANACNATGVLLGGGTSPFVGDPLPILNGDGTPLIATAIAGGGDRACAVVASATAGGSTVSDGVVCWGEGPLGDGTENDSSVPVVVLGDGTAPIGGVSAIDGGNEVMCAVSAGNAVRCWGGLEGGLSRDETRARTVLRQGGGNVVATRVAVGSRVGCAINATNDAVCWGSNDGLTLHPTVGAGNFPAAVPIPGKWLELAPTNGEELAPPHTCGRRPGAAGLVECWGQNDSSSEAPIFGCEGSNTCTVQSDTLVNAPATSLGAGAGFSCAIFDGWPWCWGFGTTGELGARVGAIDSAYPVPIPGSASPVQVESAILNGACARTAEGAIACWGYPGLRGDPTVGTAEDRELNRKDAAIRLRGLPPAIDFDLGQAVTCAVGTDGRVRCIGTLDPGLEIDDAGTGVQVGFLGTMSQRGPDMPYEIPGLDDVRDIELGAAHACALKTDGTVWCWGESVAGATGELGADDCGGIPCSIMPRQVMGIPGPVAELGLGGFTSFTIYGFSCARLTDGRVACWGNNQYGTLGDGTMTDSPTPVLVNGIDDAISLQVGPLHACVLRSDGRQLCWGIDVGGTLGTTGAIASCGFFPCASSPVLSIGIAGATSIGVGLNRTCASIASGDVYCWGGGESFVGDTGPVPSAPVAGVAFPRAIVAGNDTHCALAADAVLCWGASSQALSADAHPDEPERFVVPTYVPGL
ncbi:MAG: hypothetical protein JJ863_08670 [Deltaproteobacteria bacterium]|nr:hypothetical protein [Deltaproteobacteria bacterium]